jgi:pimeloyl-ACP methyl ester carboxylesterase
VAIEPEGRRRRLDRYGGRLTLVDDAGAWRNFLRRADRRSDRYRRKMTLDIQPDVAKGRIQAHGDAMARMYRPFLRRRGERGTSTRIGRPVDWTVSSAPGLGLILVAFRTTVAYDPFWGRPQWMVSNCPLRVTLSADVSIAYQVMGDGPVDIILVPGFMSHIEFQHELAGWTAFLRRLSKFARVVTFDKRGQGLSDRISDAPSLEQRTDDVRAIMDAIGSKRATLFGHSEGCAMSVLFAATYRERVAKLILCGGYGRRDLPDDFEEVIAKRVQLWGTGATMKRVTPSLAANADAVDQFAKFERLSASPGALKASQLLNAHIDVSSILPTVHVPTLVLHRQKDGVVPVELGSGPIKVLARGQIG